jgi:hypothetical protein
LHVMFCVRVCIDHKHGDGAELIKVQLLGMYMSGNLAQR